jgi:hypothetical protein
MASQKKLMGAGKSVIFNNILQNFTMGIGVFGIHYNKNQDAEGNPKP